MSKEQIYNDIIDLLLVMSAIYVQDISDLYNQKYIIATSEKKPIVKSCVRVAC